jgi:tRNA(Leu) C34 or U34 (ribose-2'-O)-methylase TrmL
MGQSLCMATPFGKVSLFAKGSSASRTDQPFREAEIFVYGSEQQALRDNAAWRQL